MIVLNTRGKTVVKEVKDIVYSSYTDQWTYMIDIDRFDGEHPFTFSKIHQYCYFKKEACPDCLMKGQRERSRLRCSNDDCDTRLFDGLTIDLGTNAVSAPSVTPPMTVDEEDELEDIQYSVDAGMWLFDFHDKNSVPVIDFNPHIV